MLSRHHRAAQTDAGYGVVTRRRRRRRSALGMLRADALTQRMRQTAKPFGRGLPEQAEGQAEDISGEVVVALNGLGHTARGAGWLRQGLEPGLGAGLGMCLRVLKRGI